jgi:NADH:ubiquinone oxidoreductase subunit F (NADH-binding)
MRLDSLRAPARLIGPVWDQRENLSSYLRGGGYRAGRQGTALIEALRDADLLGRGGAGYPAWRKWSAVAAGPPPRCVVANGEEGEPASVKDRYLLRHRPHLVLDGLLRALAAVGAERAIVYLSDAAAQTSVHRALVELGARGDSVEVVRVDPSYVAGEETAVVRAIEGGAPLPVTKPPRPFEAGVGGGATLIANVETLACVPPIATDDGGGDSFLCTISGACGGPGLFELPYGVTLGEAIEELAGGLIDRPVAVLAGGFFGGIHPPWLLEIPLSHASLRAAGAGLGCGAFTVLGEAETALDAAAEIVAYFAAHNARQCGPCISGTAAMRDALRALSSGAGAAADLERLERWSRTLPGRGACATLDGAAGLVRSLLDGFPTELENALGHHRVGSRSAGFDPALPARRFFADLDDGGLIDACSG